MNKTRKFRIAGGTFLLYRLVNKVNGKAYIGITSRSLHGRWIEHRSDALSNKSDQPIHRAIRKYGAENFAMELLEEAESWEALCQREKDEIAIHRKQRTLYNASWGGEGTYGIDRSYMTGANNWNSTPEARARMSKNSHMRNPEHRERMRKFNPAKIPGAMDCIKGDLNPAKRPEVRERLKATNRFNDPDKREEALEKHRAAISGSKKPNATGSGNHKARGVSIHGVSYGCMKDAAEALGVSAWATIKYRIQRGVPGYYWAGEEPSITLMPISPPQPDPAPMPKNAFQLSFLGVLVPSE